MIRRGLAVLLLAGPVFASAEEPVRGPDIAVARAAGPIAVDGDLADPGWAGAVRVETWYEIHPGENIPPPVRTVATLAYDGDSFYAGFTFLDPEPAAIRAPYSDRDAISESIDYGGIVLDTRNDGRTAILFLATPRGIQYDAVQDDASQTEDPSPDFYWDAAGRITPEGWTLEIRVPFSSLRYGPGDPQTWGILLFRNYPRNDRHEIFSAPLPRGSSCFLCHEHALTGLAGLPSGDHAVLAPYVSAKQVSAPVGEPGSPLDSGDVDGTAGVDLKWIPAPDHAVDATLNPDFSQVESDVTRISANERFAILYPEKRAFFLEGSEMFSTNIPAVYTRTITSPRWGARATGRSGGTAYTALVTEDRGGGSVIVPGPEASSFAEQDFESAVAVARVRHDLGASYVGFLVTDREIEGGGFNRVAGPDLQWRPNDTDVVAAQLLWSATETPNRLDLEPTWDGRSLSGGGADIWWSHTTRTFDLGLQTKLFDDDFRADCGFVPQVGILEGYGETGYTWHRTGSLSRVRAFVLANHIDDTHGALLRSLVGYGAEAHGPWGSRAKLWVYDDEMRSGGEILPRRQVRFELHASPSRAIADLELEGFAGEEIDLENERPGRGASVEFGGTVRPGDHLALRLDGERRWLDVSPDGVAPRTRLFTAHVERVKATYTFTARSYLRLIGQWERVSRDPGLYTYPVDAEEGGFTGSVLFSYKLNWQSVLFAGYGDERVLGPEGSLVRSGRDLFLKLSYAFQR